MGTMRVGVGLYAKQYFTEYVAFHFHSYAGGLGFVLPDCAKVACRSIDLQLVSTTGQPFSLVLLDGTTFTTYAVNTTTMKALPGQHVVKPGQSVPILLALDKKATKSSS